jgi:hypothetical protein
MQLAGLLNSFKEKYRNTRSVNEQLKASCGRQGPWYAYTVESVKINVSTEKEHKGGMIAPISQARKAGATEDETYIPHISDTIYRELALEFLECGQCVKTTGWFVLH